MYCNQCGTENSDSSKFCRSCGAQLKTIKTSTPKMNFKRYLLFAIPAMLVIIAIICITNSVTRYSDKKEIGDCLVKFVRYYNNEDIDNFHKCFNDAVQDELEDEIDRNGTDMGSIVCFLYNATEFFTCNEIYLKEYDITFTDKNKAIVEANMNLDGDNETVPFNFIYKNGKWSIYGISGSTRLISGD